MDFRIKALIRIVAAGAKCVLLWLAATLGFLCKSLIVAWCLLALYYSNLPWLWIRTFLAIVFLLFGVWALFFRPNRRKMVGFSIICGFILLWWSLISPSHERPWKPEVARMPRAIIDGDQLRISNFRNFQYRSNDDFDIRYEERVFDLTDLESVDFFVTYWMPGPVGHTFLSFDFGNDDPLCISIEIRPETGEEFAPLGSMFKQFELIYVAGDERDIVGVRTEHRHEEVYLYRTRTSPANARALLEHYLERMNRLAHEPEFYHLLSNSCTVNTIYHARASAGLQKRFDIRHLLNGLIDQVLYSEGLVDTTLPFGKLRSESRITDKAKSVGGMDFSSAIRRGLPTIPPSS